ncbi:hypothetical protein ACU5EH_00665 [Aliivibrio salmonicida]|uniref:hypothetical protein n=1 Tax=Aliivibrio salmonicida TaxID=40269 RepID=UPI00406D055D
MQKYSNFGGDSNVHSFEIAADSITVVFNGGATYLYTIGSTGITDIVEMKRLAMSGQGLNSYIGRVVKKRFARKLR